MPCDSSMTYHWCHMGPVTSRASAQGTEYFYAAIMAKNSPEFNDQFKNVYVPSRAACFAEMKTIASPVNFVEIEI